MKTGGRDIGVKTGRLPVKPGGLAGMGEGTVGYNYV